MTGIAFDCCWGVTLMQCRCGRFEIGECDGGGGFSKNLVVWLEIEASNGGFCGFRFR